MLLHGTQAMQSMRRVHYKPDVSLSDEDTGVVDRLGKAELEHLCLETTLKEVLNLETEHVIELHVLLVEDTNADETAQECVTLKQTAGVL